MVHVLFLLDLSKEHMPACTFRFHGLRSGLNFIHCRHLSPGEHSKEKCPNTSLCPLNIHNRHCEIHKRYCASHQQITFQASNAPKFGSKQLNRWQMKTAFLTSNTPALGHFGKLMESQRQTPTTLVKMNLSFLPESQTCGNTTPSQLYSVLR